MCKNAVIVGCEWKDGSCVVGDSFLDLATPDKPVQALLKADLKCMAHSESDCSSDSNCEYDGGCAISDSEADKLMEAQCAKHADSGATLTAKDVAKFSSCADATSDNGGYCTCQGDVCMLSEQMIAAKAPLVAALTLTCGIDLTCQSDGCVTGPGGSCVLSEAEAQSVATLPGGDYAVALASANTACGAIQGEGACRADARCYWYESDYGGTTTSYCDVNTAGVWKATGVQPYGDGGGGGGGGGGSNVGIVIGVIGAIASVGVLFALFSRHSKLKRSAAAHASFSSPGAATNPLAVS